VPVQDAAFDISRDYDKLDQNDCGLASSSIAGTGKQRFLDACSARTRTFYEGIGGMVLSATGLALIAYAVIVKEPESTPVTAQRAPRRSIVIAPTIAPGSAGATLALEW